MNVVIVTFVAAFATKHFIPFYSDTLPVLLLLVPAAPCTHTVSLTWVIISPPYLSLFSPLTSNQPLRFKPACHAAARTPLLLRWLFCHNAILIPAFRAFVYLFCAIILAF